MHAADVTNEECEEVRQEVVSYRDAPAFIEALRQYWNTYFLLSELQIQYLDPKNNCYKKYYMFVSLPWYYYLHVAEFPVGYSSLFSQMLLSWLQISDKNLLIFSVYCLNQVTRLEHGRVTYCPLRKLWQTDWPISTNRPTNEQTGS